MVDVGKERKIPRWTIAMRKEAKALGKLGGFARAAKLTPERRSQIAKQAVDAREARRKS